MFKRQSTLSLVMIAMFAALTAIGAFIKIPLPVVPFTLQIVFVFLAGSLLGSRNGLQSQLVYIGVGLVGLPVFTQGGGITYVLQPTFGFLIGFALAALVIGFMIERVDTPTKKHFIGANIVGLFIIYAVAVPYLYVSLNFWLHMKTSWSHIFVVGFLNSIVADFCLAIASAFLAERLYKVFNSARTITSFSRSLPPL
ncbi:biotin transporter BioY [Lysinibacillus xylanilyticus]|uniref:biotin transporter BioY n=1 Tax=Lysinibacillus xylanilyticus TaxID=582475 RepID=UPI002B23F71E|nr:biotin transporter BioY [Lysinibacillus xylanilyticus]MEB2282114.1 biotin transporter BioY [Lysinibacillus xylanilyticus]